MEETTQVVDTGLEIGNAAAPESTAPETKSTAPETADGTTPETPAYTPDYKFSAYGEEGEVEETWRQYIKDKKSEEEFKKLYSKAHAFEKSHEKLERTRGEYQKTATELAEYQKGLGELRGYVQTKDFESFFKKLNIPMATVWEWVNDKVNYQELSPEQKVRYDNEMRLKRENLELQNKYKSTDETHSQTMARLVNIELDFALSKPEYAEHQSAFDQKYGKGSFREFVIDRGDALERKTKREVPFEEAIKDAMRFVDIGTTQAPDAGQPLVAKSSNKPVIPNIKGGGAAPVKKRPQNLKELRAEIERRQQADS